MGIAGARSPVRRARSPGSARPPSRVASQLAAPAPPVTSVRLHPRAAAARSSVPTRALRTSPARASGSHLPGAASARPAAAQLGWSWGPERTPCRLQPGAPRRRLPSVRDPLSAPLRSRDGKSWRRRRLPGQAERAPSGRGASGDLSPGRPQQPLLLLHAAPRLDPTLDPDPWRFSSPGTAGSGSCHAPAPPYETPVCSGPRRPGAVSGEIWGQQGVNDDRCTLWPKETEWSGSCED